MKYQKIRGHKRRQRSIRQWKLDNLNFRLSLNENRTYDYIKIIVHPWCDISIINSAFPEPKGKTKQLILSSLIEIYDAWKKQLDNLSQPYYLKIWLYEPRFSKSQVVCAIGKRIDYYENLFPKAGDNKHLRTGNYGHLKNELDKLDWEHSYDEELIESDYVGKPDLYLTEKDFLEDKKWFNKMMTKPHRTSEFSNGKEYYLFNKGNLWLGS